MRNSIAHAFFAITLVALFSSSLLAQQTATVEALVLERESTSRGDVSRGHFEVYENRAAQTGRKIKLNVVVLHARSDNPQPDPLFFLAGGPGQAAGRIAGGFANHWARADRDIVLVSQRGTDLDNCLAFQPEDGDQSLQKYLKPFLTENVVRTNLERLQKDHDLRMYSTPMAMDDLNDIREALGYDKINLMGGSYGTRASLVYIRRHGSTVRSAILNGCAPIEFVNPLYHAEAAQYALDKLFEEVESSEKYRQVFGDLRQKFATILKRLETDGPVEVEIKNTGTGETEKILFDRESFVGSLRFQMYYLNTSRRVPLLIQQAYEGNFRTFATSSIRRNMALGNAIAAGMLLSVTSAEDVARIKPEQIEPLTGDTYLGDGRVRRQMAAAEIWPHSDLPEGFGNPVQSDVPMLILSGTIDPVTPPKWGEKVADNFPNSLHVIAPAAHGVGGACINSLQQQFLETGSVKGLDTSCVADMKLPPLVLPEDQ